MTRLANKSYHDKYSEQAQSQPDITVYFLQASRSIRTVWLLEELGIPYKIECANRVNQKAPEEFKQASGNPLGKFPTIKDGEIVVHESGNIVEYLCEHYDTAHKMIPENDHLRNRVRMFIHAAEGTLMIHGLAVLYSRWSMPAELKESNPEAVEKMEAALGVSVQKDLDWVEGELERSTGRFLVGDSVTAADCMMLFSVQFIRARELGIKNNASWPKINEWTKVCEDSETYKEAVRRSNYTLHP